MKLTEEFRWFNARGYYAARCRQCERSSEVNDDYNEKRRAQYKTQFEIKRCAPVRTNVIAPELMRRIRLTHESDRPKCPTCGQVAARGNSQFLLKWCHRDLAGEPCPGWHPRETEGEL